ncbi:MAG: tripartite tricarboxylate transporter substrate binding protein [Pseudolabrys sp.]|nr:tripartite tricarboxylate transporter substrate binding protein [Pseudolabrys sp.]
MLEGRNLAVSRRARRGWNVVACVSTMFVVAAGSSALAQQWPTKPITAISPFGPGTSLEAAARPVFEKMSQDLGQAIVIEHRAGAGSATGSAAAARAAPDGYTLLLQSSTFSIVHSVSKNRTYDTLKDFTPIASFGAQPYVLVTAPSKGYRTLGDLIAAAKTSSGKMNYASLGVGSAPHIAAERFRLAAGIEAQNIAFRGPPDALTETMTGRLDFYFTALGSALALIKEGKLTALAVSTTARAKELPDVPTLKEAGLKEDGFELWLGFFAPANTPADIVGRLHAAAQKAMQDETVKQRLATLSLTSTPMTLEQFAEYFRKDVEDSAKIVSRAKIEIN